MKLTFHGAARTTTGPIHLVETGTQRILLDCGLYQGHRDEAFQRNSNLPFDPKTINTAFLSHAHIDHSGNWPTLVRNGFAGEINCTTATRDLVTLMRRDSARIQEQDAEYLNQKSRAAGCRRFDHSTQFRMPSARCHVSSAAPTKTGLTSSTAARASCCSMPGTSSAPPSRFWN